MVSILVKEKWKTYKMQKKKNPKINKFKKKLRKLKPKYKYCSTPFKNSYFPQAISGYNLL